MHSFFSVPNFLRGRLVFVLTALLLFSVSVMAQQPATEAVPMADQLRADGKIWVVVGVIALVFAGIVVYLIRLDGQIGKLEKEIMSEKTVKTNL